MRFVRFIFVFLIAFGNLYSAEDPKVGSIREFYRSIRAMGMGNAYMGSVKNCEAIYYNPAALGRLRKRVTGEIINPQVGVNRKVYGLATNISDIMSDGSQMAGFMEDMLGSAQYGAFTFL